MERAVCQVDDSVIMLILSQYWCLWQEASNLHVLDWWSTVIRCHKACCQKLWGGSKLLLNSHADSRRQVGRATTAALSGGLTFRGCQTRAAPVPSVSDCCCRRC